jgi:K+:H+ antiporter
MAAGSDAATATVLVDLAVMTAVGGGLARLATKCRQPAVIGEVVAGILLGPTLLGLLPGHLTERLFPTEIRPFLMVLANVGLVLFMFGIGFELNLGTMRRLRSSVAAGAVSVASILVPLALGAGTAVLLYPAHRDGIRGGGLLSFALFMGVAMAITAFPVLARILSECGLANSRLGTFTMTCAAAADIMAWGLLALVVTLVAGADGAALVWRVGGILLFMVGLVTVVRPLLRVLLTRAAGRHQASATVAVTVAVALFLSAWTTAKLGFHPIFGAFALGAVMPRDAVRDSAPEVPLLIENASRLLVPVFFVTTGLTVNISALGLRGALEAVLVVVAACAGKFLGATAAARACGMDRRRAAAVGVLMNSRGLTELVVIQVGVSMGIVDTELASIMVIMALVTTVMALPLFTRLYDDRLRREDVGESGGVGGEVAAGTATAGRRR